MQTEYNSEVTGVRIQVIVFRDLECDVEALEKSEFFELPNDTKLFEDYLNGIVPRGGGDYKESGLEALFTAMTTDWKAKKNGDRQVIILFSDADAIDFNEKRNRTDYPDMCNKDDFLKAWNCSLLGNQTKLQKRNQRLVMFAPAKSVYEKLQSELGKSWFNSVESQKGMADVSFEDIMKLLCASVAVV